jgi:uncharacterized protein YdeI (YjbR/CyaY-like superfamily)
MPKVPKYFKTPAEFRAWLAARHATETELLVGFRKRDSGKPSITWPESVDQALCFGWIDGVRRSIDAENYSIRFTPRRKTSIWSQINIARFQELRASGLVSPAGEAAFASGKERTSRYSHENALQELAPAELARFRKNQAAWAYFESRPPSYRKTAIWWVVSARKPETRERRLSTLMEDSAAGRKIKQLDLGRK